MDVLLLRVGDEFGAGKNRVALDLIYRGDEVSSFDQGLEVGICEVRHAHGAYFALGQFVHSLPCFAVRHRVINVHLIRIGGGRKQVTMWILSRPKVHRPVDQIQVEVVQFELSKRVVERGFDMLRVVLCVPKLRGDEDVLTLQARDVVQGTLDALGDFLLVFVAVIGGKMS